MKRITLFYLENCPFCNKARAAIDELKKQDRYKDIEIEMIEESKQPEVADKYDYYYVPTFYIEGARRRHLPRRGEGRLRAGLGVSEHA